MKQKYLEIKLKLINFRKALASKSCHEHLKTKQYTLKQNYAQKEIICLFVFFEQVEYFEGQMKLTIYI